MAEETRRQRRDARRAAGQEPAARSAAPLPAPAGPEGAAPVVDHGRRGGFVRESIGELRKVEWPNRAQVIQGTMVVLIACAIVGAFLWGADQVLRPFVREVLLGQ